MLLLSEDINNTISLDLFYRGLVTLLGYSLPRLAPDRLVTIKREDRKWDRSCFK